MPPRRHGGFGGGTHLLDRTVTVYDWAPPGWHWEESGERRLVRNPGPVRDPDLVWWKHHGPGYDQREPATEEDIRRRIRDEDAHVLRYMSLLSTTPDRTWNMLQRDPNPSMTYYPVRVPVLWRRSAPRSAPPGFSIPDVFMM